MAATAENFISDNDKDEDDNENEDDGKDVSPAEPDKSTRTSTIDSVTERKRKYV